MPTRREQLHAHRFQRRRAVAALVTGRPDPGEPPMRRLTATTLCGFVLAAAVTAGCAALGVLRPGPDHAWQGKNVVIVENETAAVYIRLAGVLHPVVNYASAVLAVSADRPARVVHVARRVLDRTSRGALLGIPQLPVALPSAQHLAGSPFTVCSRGGTGDDPTPKVSVGVGTDLGSVALTADDAIVVRATNDGALFLVANGRRFALTSSQVVRSLQLDTAPVLGVAPAVLDGVPAGPPLRTPVVPAAGSTFPWSVAGHVVSVGRLLHDTDDDHDLLVLADGVADLTELQARLLQTVRLPPAETVASPLDVSRTDLLDLPQSTTAWRTVQAQLTELPADVPHTRDGPARRGGLCAVYRGRMAAPTLAVPAAATAPDGAPASGSPASGSGAPPGGVLIGSGGAALLRSPDRPGTTYLVAEPGRRYAAPSPDVLAGFGYAHAAPTTVPARLLALIPLGAVLDPAAARRPVPA